MLIKLCLTCQIRVCFGFFFFFFFFTIRLMYSYCWNAMNRFPGIIYSVHVLCPNISEIRIILAHTLDRSGLSNCTDSFGYIWNMDILFCYALTVCLSVCLSLSLSLSLSLIYFQTCINTTTKSKPKKNKNASEKERNILSGRAVKLARVTGPEFPHPFSPVGRCLPATGRCRAAV